MAAVKQPRKRTGPAPRGPFEGKRKTITTRITERNRLRLEEAAEGSDRSLSQEIEIRLDRSFTQDDARYDELGGKDSYKHYRLMELARTLVEEQTGQSWREDYDTYYSLLTAWIHLLSVYAPAKPDGWDDKAARPPLRYDGLLAKEPTPESLEAINEWQDPGKPGALAFLRILELAKQSTPKDQHTRRGKKKG